MTWFLKTVLSVIFDKFWDLSVDFFKDAALKRGIKVIAEKNVAYVEDGDAALDSGNIQGWLDALNKEE
jgi:hypothetical protein